MRTEGQSGQEVADQSRSATPLPSAGPQLCGTQSDSDSSPASFTSHTPGRFSTRERQDSSIASASEENEINDARLRAFQEKHEAMFLALLRECGFEHGFDSAADVFIEDCLRENRLVTMHWLGLLFFDRFSDPSVLVGILGVLAHLDYALVFPHGLSIAAAATRHSCSEVKEGGVRAFERWAAAAPAALEILGQLSFSASEEWLRDYASAVMDDLRASVAS